MRQFKLRTTSEFEVVESDDVRIEGFDTHPLVGGPPTEDEELYSLSEEDDETLANNLNAIWYHEIDFASIDESIHTVSLNMLRSDGPMQYYNRMLGSNVAQLSQPQDIR